MSDDYRTPEERQVQTQSELALLSARNLSRLSDQLLPCPFCGEAGEMTTGRSAGDSRPFFNPSCAGCNYVFADGFYNGEDAVKAWNERAPITIEDAARIVYQRYGANLAAFWREAFAVHAARDGRTDCEPSGVDGNCRHCIPICRRCQIATIESHLKDKEALAKRVRHETLNEAAQIAFEHHSGLADQPAFRIREALYAEAEKAVYPAPEKSVRETEVTILKED